MERHVKLAAAVVGLHTVVNAVHGLPHAAIPVALAGWQWAFVVGVVFLGPLAALWLGWRGRSASGWVLLAASLAASLAFGVSFHFAVPNPDHVHAVSAGTWRGSFAVTAVLAAVVDAVGVLAGVRLAADALGGGVSVEA